MCCSHKITVAFFVPLPVYQAVWWRHADKTGGLSAGQRWPVPRFELWSSWQASRPWAVQHTRLPTRRCVEYWPLELGTALMLHACYPNSQCYNILGHAFTAKNCHAREGVLDTVLWMPGYLLSILPWYTLYRVRLPKWRYRIHIPHAGMVPRSSFLCLEELYVCTVIMI